MLVEAGEDDEAAAEESAGDFGDAGGGTWLADNLSFFFLSLFLVFFPSFLLSFLTPGPFCPGLESRSRKTGWEADTHAPSAASVNRSVPSIRCPGPKPEKATTHKAPVAKIIDTPTLRCTDMRRFQIRQMGTFSMATSETASKSRMRRRGRRRRGSGLGARGFGFQGGRSILGGSFGVSFDFPRGGQLQVKEVREREE